MMNNELKKAKELFYKKDYISARKIFVKLEDFYGAGLCSLLLQETDEAKRYWVIDKKNCPGSNWGLCILKYIDLKQGPRPTFFQTRAFLEVYLNLFFENNLIEWAENILSSSDIIADSNPEAYKFIARSLYANGYFELAMAFCKKSLEVFYADPEAFLILAQCQFLTNDYPGAMETTNKIIKIVPDYYPAVLFKQILKEEMIKKKVRIDAGMLNNIS